VKKWSYKLALTSQAQEFGLLNFKARH